MASVVVVGAGLAGLCCAWRLQRAGFDVEVLERAEQSGGRLQSERVDEFLLEGGATFFTSHDRSLHSIFDHLDLSSEVQSVSRFPDALIKSGEFTAMRPNEDPLLLRSKLISRRASLRLLRLRLESRRFRNHLGAPDQEAISSLESQDVASYLDRIVGEEIREQIFVPYLSAVLELNSENLSAMYLHQLIGRVAGARPQYLVGGMVQLTARLARGISIRNGCEVTSIETHDDGVRLRYRAGEREGSVAANAVVVAIPGSQVVDICPKLTPNERGFFEGVRYSRGVVAHLLFDEAMSFPYRSVSFARRKGFGLYGVQAAHHKRGAAPNGAGLLRASLTEAASERVFRGSNAEVQAMVLDDLASTPFGKLSPRRVVVHRAAAASPVFYPGYLAGLQRFAARSERSPRIAYCGDYLIGNGAEAALNSGMRAASQIARGFD
ncbi:MAG: FAD-dependent oxidoreductase [Myxococcales bacterium]|nr:FAD-dependent oxidoreductase [Myxococcales bacterium]